MLAAISRLGPAAAKFTRQIVPPVIATLIAAGLISAYNRAFSGHLQQPRMAALHHEAAEPASEPAAKALAPADALAIYDNIAPPPRLWEKEGRQESGKDQTIKLAEPVPAPVRAAAPRPERAEPRVEQRRVAAVEPSPVVRTPAPAMAPAPVIIAVPSPVVSAPGAAPPVVSMPTVQELRQPVLPPPPPQYQQQPYQQPQYGQPQYQQPPYQPPPVVTAQPMVTVPDRTRPVAEAQAEPANPPQGPIGKFVDALTPSSLFARAREFGEKIEQAGNDILPSIRQ